jgi:hypothetical protein
MELDLEDTTDNYVLCSFKLGMTNACVTRYSASASGQCLDAIYNTNQATNYVDSLKTEYSCLKQIGAASLRTLLTH